MKKLIFSTIVFSLSFFCLAQDGWHQLSNAPANLGRFDDVFFITDDIGWAANGPSAVVFKTTDGGDNWAQQFSGGATYFRNIEFIDENIGFLGTLDGVFYKTSDGGDNWSTVSISPNPPAICGLDAVGSSTIYGCGAYFTPAFIIKSVDSGTSWQYIDMSAYSDGLVEVLFIDEDHGFASGNGYDGGVILETLDGGVSWTEIFNSGVTGEYVWKLQLLENNTVIFASIESPIQGKLAKSFDSGASWEMKSFPDTSVQGIGFISRTHGWMGGHGSGFYKTLDGGDTWTDMGLGWSLNRFVFLSPTLGFCSGESIYKFTGSLGVGDFEQVPVNDLKITIAPMPVTNKLTIEIDYQHTDNLLLGLYTMDGKFIKRLIRDQVGGAGLKAYSFDFEYPAGSYLLDFHTNYGRRSKIVLKE